MKKIYLSIVILVAIWLTALNVKSQTAWTEKASYPGNARYYDASFTIGHYGFVGCGLNQGTTYTNFYKWNQSTNTWSSITAYPGLGSDAPVTASIEGKGYVGLGFDGTNLYSDLWQYDTTSDSWTAMASLPAAGRYDASFFTIGHKLYVIGGSTGGPPYLEDVWVYDTHKNTWTQLNNSPAGKVDNMVAFSIGNHGYIGGGWDGSNTQNAFWQYDTTSDTWTSITAIPSVDVWADPRTFVLGSKAYVCNGFNGNSHTLPLGYVYDTTSKVWTIFTNMGANGIERAHAVAFAIGNYGYIGTGQDSLGNYLADLWQYNSYAAGINTVSLQQGEVTVYPNPNDGMFYLSYNKLEGQSSKLIIEDIFGRVVSNYNLTGNEGKLVIDESRLSKGLYLYKLIDAGNCTYNGKLVIQ